MTWLKHHSFKKEAEKRRDEKGKGERERYSQLDAEFQRLARRDKKAFLSEQCKELEENNRMAKTRDLFKKIKDTKRTFHPNMGTIKERNSKELREAEEIKKKWQEYTEELYKKDLNNLDEYDGVVNSPGVRHPGMWSQVGLRKYYYEQS